MQDITKPDYSLALELLPEFGWSVEGGEPVYSPGSVFQGFVRISSSSLQQHIIKASSLQIKFRAVEIQHPIENKGRRCQSLFAIKHNLWKGRCLNLSISSSPSFNATAASRSFPFVIQMPMVQYPPSIYDHVFYQCSFTLIAIIENNDRVIKSTEKKISYRPFIETSLVKQPIIFSASIPVDVKLSAFGYVPGDKITATIVTSNSNSNTTTCSRSTTTTHDTNYMKRRIIITKLYQISTLHSIKDVPDLVKMVASSRWIDEDEEGNYSNQSLINLLHIPSHVVPSFSYSCIMTISYRLKIWIKQRKLNGFWEKTKQVMEFPLTIGTLGYGIPAPSQLQIYSVISSQQQQQQQQQSGGSEEQRILPQFLRTIEYSDSLPLYESYRLPNYNEYSR